jgi:hypothetical protein
MYHEGRTRGLARVPPTLLEALWEAIDGLSGRQVQLAGTGELRGRL